jgi:fermentation-respiration switch protein FrsA (DUF1100 family)
MKSTLLMVSIIVAAGCIGSLNKAPASQSSNEPKSVFDYDKKIPLDVSLNPYVENDRFTSWKLTFQGHKGKVPGVLAVPKGKSQKFPVLILMHGLGGNKEVMNPFALAAIPLGYATLALDAPAHGERANGQSSNTLGADIETMRSLWQQGIIDYRRALDYLSTREDIDTKRIALLGVSMGGMMGTLLAGCDERIRAAAILIAGGDYITIAETSVIPQAKLMQEAIQKIGKEKAREILTPIDPLTWAPKISPRPVLFVNGKKDLIIPLKSAEALIAAAKEPKTVIWEDGGHTLSAQAILRIQEWIVANTPKP